MLTLATPLGWYQLVHSDETSKKEGVDCKEVGYTDQAKQREEGYVNCPDNFKYFLIVAGAFVAGLVVSYVILQLIIKCSQYGTPQKNGKKKESEKKAQEKKKEEGAKKDGLVAEKAASDQVPPAAVAAADSGANGGISKV